MTREEAAIKSCEDRIKHLESAPPHHYGKRQRERAIELEKVKIKALRPIGREQVEKVWRGEWIPKHYVDGILEGTNFDECSKCGYQRVFENPELKTKYMFCPGCGRAMWDEAVQMLMERLEALKDGKID